MGWGHGGSLRGAHDVAEHLLRFVAAISVQLIAHYMADHPGPDVDPARTPVSTEAKRPPSIQLGTTGLWVRIGDEWFERTKGS